MKTSLSRYGLLCLFVVGSLGILTSCRNPGWPAPEPGPANYRAGLGPANYLAGPVPVNYLAGPRPGEALGGGSREASDVQVRIEDFKFEPSSITVAPGTKITWVNKDDEPHSATSTEKPKRFDSGVLDSAQSFSFTFSERGSFRYFCKLHPHMTGVIEVR